MGQEIDHYHFQPRDFTRFQKYLTAETALLRECFSKNAFGPDQTLCGFELEAWLIDANCDPAPKIDQLIDHARSDLIVPEVAKFNFELNSSPQTLHPETLSTFEAELSATWGSFLWH